MKILVIGSGGREHALVDKISQNPHVEKIFVAPGNAGIGQMATCVPIAVDDINALVLFAQNEKIDLTVVGPELPLTLGLVDEFQKQGLACFGPSQRASIIEGSKVFTKEFCARHKIPTAKSFTFQKEDHALAYLMTLEKFPTVIKLDGLAQGKGVVVASDIATAQEAVHNFFKSHPQQKIIIEDFLPGQEASFFIATDGEKFVELGSAQDHKRVFDLDTGPNTGGMGAYAHTPIVTESVRQKIIDKIVYPTLIGLKEENRKFVGFLFIGLMIHNEQPFVIEYNCRLGDPETEVLLPLLESDLVELIQNILNRTVHNYKLKLKPQSAVTVVLASGGYPGKYTTGYKINGLDSDFKKNIRIYHAGTQIQNGDILTQGGRVLAVTALGNTLFEAITDVYQAIQHISWPNMHYRKDIAQKGLS